MNSVDNADVAAQAASSKALATTLAGAGTLSWGGWTSNDLAMAVGAFVAVAGLLVQWYYRRDENKLRHAEHAMLVREHEKRLSEMSEHCE